MLFYIKCQRENLFKLIRFQIWIRCCSWMNISQFMQRLVQYTSPQFQIKYPPFLKTPNDVQLEIMCAFVTKPNTAQPSYMSVCQQHSKLYLYYNKYLKMFIILFINSCLQVLYYKNIQERQIVMFVGCVLSYHACF